MLSIKNILVKFLNPLKQAEQQSKQNLKEFKESVLQATNWSEKTFYNKLNGHTPITDNEKDAIIKIVKTPQWVQRLQVNTSNN